MATAVYDTAYVANFDPARLWPSHSDFHTAIAEHDEHSDGS